MALQKVYGGTPVGNESRCETCSYSRLIRGYRESELLTFCEYGYPTFRVPFRVAECSNYEDRRIPNIKALEKVALMVEVRPSGAGFIPSDRADLCEQDDD